MQILLFIIYGIISTSLGYLFIEKDTLTTYNSNNQTNITNTSYLRKAILPDKINITIDVDNTYNHKNTVIIKYYLQRRQELANHFDF